MHVGVVVYDGLEQTTGGFIYDRKLVDTLRSSGHRVTVEGLPWRSYARNLLDNLSTGIRSRLRSLGAAADIIVQDELCHPSLAWSNRVLDRDVPVVALVHHLRAREPSRSAVAAWVERLYLAGVDAFICSSNTTRAEVASLLGRDSVPGIVATPGGDRFAPAVSPGDIAARARTPGPLRIVYVGSVVPRKGLDVLLEGVARLPRRAWTLTVVGDRTTRPDYTAHVAALVRQHELSHAVSFRGQLSDRALAATLTASHVLAVPSRYEGFGIVYLEAMGFGLPAIGTTAGGAAEIIQDGTSGFLVPPDSPRAIAAVLEELCSDREHLAEMAAAARARYESFPGWTETMRRPRDYLETLV